MGKSVRRANVNDVKSIMDLISDVAKTHWENRGDIFRLNVLPYTESSLMNLIENGEMNIFVSTDELGVVTGVLLCDFQTRKGDEFIQDFKTLKIEETCVGGAYRGLGYGKALMDYAKEFAKENNCTRVELNVWSFNKNAREFYESQGMKEQRSMMEIIL